MKEIITLFAVFLTTVIYSQQQSFIGEDSDLIIGKKVRLKADQNKEYYKGFYKDENLTKIVFRKSLGSNPKKLNNIDFEVVRAFKSEVKYYTDRDIILELYNKKTGKIYYAYNSKSSIDFMLNIVGGIEYPEDFFCKKLKVEEDTFSKNVRIKTPETYEYSIVKIQTKDSSSLYLQLNSYGNTLNSNIRGLKVKFSDGTILEKPNAKIRYKNELDLKGWTYSSLIALNEQDIETLSTKRITNYSLYIYERKMNDKNSFELKEFLKCMMK